MSISMNARGLHNFISDIRNSNTKELEVRGSHLSQDPELGFHCLASALPHTSLAWAVGTPL